MGTLDPLLMLADELDPPDSGYRTDPVAWGEDKLGYHCWSKIGEICQSVVENRYTAVHSCHGIGKSWSSGGLIVPWWIDVHPVGEAFVVTSAPTAPQIEAIIWREIGRTHRKGRLRGRLTGGSIPKWKIGDELVAFGRKPQDLSNEDEARQAFQGIHAKYVLVVLDEACGIPGWLWDAALALVTNEFCRILAIGNPDDPTSRFKDICLMNSNWNTIHVDAFDSPLFTGEYVPDELKHLLISPTWVDEMREEWGEDSPLFESKVRGRFPLDSEWGVVPYSYMGRCRNLGWEYTTHEQQPNELGVDPAATGDKFTVHWRTGPKWRRKWSWNHADTMVSADEVVRIILETGAESVKIDSIGIGKGVADRLAQLKGDRHEAEIHLVNTAQASTNKKKFKNLRAQLWWECGRELMEKVNCDLTDLDDQTAHQLCAVRYGFDATGHIQIEPKEDTKERIRRSPDDADAFLLAYYKPSSDNIATHISTVTTSEPIVRRGDLVLKGDKYVDKK